MQTHNKPFMCHENGCTRPEGFATINDLERHRKAVHKLDPRVGQNVSFVCSECVKADTSGIKQRKVWPRKDNFAAHIKRKHVDTESPKEVQNARVKEIVDA